MPALDFPASPTNGQVYGNWIYSTSKGAWQAKPLTSAVATTSDTAPLNPDNGDLWYNTTDGSTYVYYVDGTSAQWVQTKSDSTFTSTLGPRVDALEIKSPNYIINGAFDIWQRGTSLSAGAFTHRADRWIVDQAVTVSRSTDVPAGIEAGYSMLIPAGTGAATSRQAIELPGTSIAGIFSEGKTFTLSFYAKSTASRDLNISATFRNGVVGTNYLTVLNAVPVGTATSSWSRFSYTFTIPAGSITGANCLPIVITAAAGASADVYITGVQLEAGTIATTFRRNANSIQGELAACQRYYYRRTSDTAIQHLVSGWTANTATFAAIVYPPVSMRVTPTSVETSAMSTFTVRNGDSTTTVTPTSITLSTQASSEMLALNVAATVTGNQVGYMRATAVGAYIGFSAEL